MYEKSFEFYDAIYSWKDYPKEVARLHGILAAAGVGQGKLLDVACGTGRHLQLLKDLYDVQGLELDAGMAAMARQRIPDITVTEGDMADFNLGETFDVVTCLFSSIGYMEEPEQLHAAIATMGRHLRPGGVLAVEPWFYPQQWFDGHVSGDMHHSEKLKIARVGRSWTEGPIACMELHHLVGTPGKVESFVETHRMALYTDYEYRTAFEAAGLTVDHDAEGLMGRGLYLGRASAIL